MERQPSAYTADQRRVNRLSLEKPIRMRIDSKELQGMSDNISGAGLMFFAEEPLRVAIEVEEEGGTVTYQGRLVRAQKMSESTTGYAIEFDAR
ncbi:MAG: PilZ domain-containing protein [Planctomycetota bacterium]